MFFFSAYFFFILPFPSSLNIRWSDLFLRSCNYELTMDDCDQILLLLNWKFFFFLRRNIKVQNF